MSRAATVASSTRTLGLRPSAQAVAVLSIDPHDGSTLATAAGVTGCRTAPALAQRPVEGGGEVLVETCRWRLDAAPIPFRVVPGDRVTDADAVTWKVDSATLGVYGSKWIVEATRVRG